MKDLGLKIKKIRELKNYKQEHMADKLGISQSAYSRYENMETEVSEDMLKQIAEVLEVEPEQIKHFDEKTIFHNHVDTVNDEGIGIKNYTVNQYIIDPKIEKLYEDQIMLLKKQNEMLEAKIAEMEKKG
ncbi:MAG: helix-turn-helix domain-containing protein [Bacteroidota bacterium]